jgi:hypothetical protein
MTTILADAHLNSTLYNRTIEKGTNWAGAYQIETAFLRSEGRQIQEELEWILEPGPFSSCGGHVSPARGRNRCGGGDDNGSKGDSSWDGMEMARGESRRGRRGGNGGGVEVSCEKSRGELSRAGRECRPVWRGRTGFPVKTRLLRDRDPRVACLQTARGNYLQGLPLWGNDWEPFGIPYCQSRP